MSSIDLVIFDCDGTLIDSEILACQVEAEAYTKIGYEINWESFAERFAGMTTLEIQQQIFDEMGRPPELGFHDMLMEKIDERFETDLQQIAGASEILSSIDFPFCICSNSTDERLEKSLSATGLKPLVTPNIFSSMTVGEKQPKPHPSVFNFAVEHFGVKAKNTVVIEDSSHGIEGAKAAGCRVIGFTGAAHSFSGHADKLTDAGAETVINRLSDLPRTLEAMALWDGIA